MKPAFSNAETIQLHAKWDRDVAFADRQILPTENKSQRGKIRIVPGTKRISIFDLDRTLTRRPTYSLFLLQAAWRRAPWRLCLIPLLLPHAIAYFLELLPRKRLKETMHWLMLGSELNRAEVQNLAECFARDLVERGLYPEAMGRLRSEAVAGRRIVIASAAPAFYVEPLARLLGVADIVATTETWHGNQLCPRIFGENCYGFEKQRKLARFLRHAGIARREAHIRFFSDDLADLPTFEWCDEAIVVNPGAALHAVARERRWPVLKWRGKQGATA